MGNVGTKLFDGTWCCGRQEGERGCWWRQDVDKLNTVKAIADVYGVTEEAAQEIQRRWEAWKSWNQERRFWDKRDEPFYKALTMNRVYGEMVLLQREKSRQAAARRKSRQEAARLAGRREAARPAGRRAAARLAAETKVVRFETDDDDLAPPEEAAGLPSAAAEAPVEPAASDAAAVQPRPAEEGAAAAVVTKNDVDDAANLCDNVGSERGDGDLCGGLRDSSSENSSDADVDFPAAELESLSSLTSSSSRDELSSPTTTDVLGFSIAVALPRTGATAAALQKLQSSSPSLNIFELPPSSTSSSCTTSSSASAASSPRSSFS